MTDRSSTPHEAPNNNRSHDISRLLSFARTNYEESPAESLAALLEAVTLKTGSRAADQVMIQLRSELGDDLADHIGSHHVNRRERAQAVLQRLLDDESSELFRQGRQDILRQTIEDGTSVVCSRCNAVVGSTRWQQHAEWWCSANDKPDENKEERKDDCDTSDQMDMT
jgi:hypothetical protein